MTVSRTAGFRIVSLFSASLALAACATQTKVAEAPADAEVVATVRHVAGPRPPAPWLDLAALPADAQRSDGERALLLEVGLPDDGGAPVVETAPLELANLVIRIEKREAKQSVIGIENATAAALAYELYLSPDGERFHRVPVCAVAARGPAYERFPERAAWIAVANVRRAEDPKACD